MLITINKNLTKNLKHKLHTLSENIESPIPMVHDNTIFSIFLTPPTPIFFCQKKGGHRKNIEKSCKSCTGLIIRTLIVY
jgi:hypothetical protein